MSAPRGVDRSMMRVLTQDMGFGESEAERALAATGSANIDTAINFLLTGEVAVTLPPVGGASTSASGFLESFGAAPAVGSPTSLVMGVPTSQTLVEQPDGSQVPARTVGMLSSAVAVLRFLKTSEAQVAAQCAHAALGLYRELVAARVAWLRAWEAGGEKTVVLSGSNSDELQYLERRARAVPLAAYRVIDAGRTEVAPGSWTILALAGPVELVDSVTGSLATY